MASPLEGDWRNINTSTNAMTRVVVETCQPVTTCSGSICQTTYDVGTFMTPYGKCSPTDCNWGRRQAEYMTDGWIRTIHNFGFKTSHVWAKNGYYYGRTYPLRRASFGRPRQPSTWSSPRRRPARQAVLTATSI